MDRWYWNWGDFIFLLLFYFVCLKEIGKFYIPTDVQLRVIASDKGIVWRRRLQSIDKVEYDFG